MDRLVREEDFWKGGYILTKELVASKDRRNLMQIENNDDHTLWRAIIEKLVVLDSVAKEKNATILVTSMNSDCDPAVYLDTDMPSKTSKINPKLFDLIKNLHFIDSLDNLIYNRHDHFKDNSGHPNHNGHWLIAELIYRQLTDMKLI
jgi:hypothetical protein